MEEPEEDEREKSDTIDFDPIQPDQLHFGGQQR